MFTGICFFRPQNEETSLNPHFERQTLREIYSKHTMCTPNHPQVYLVYRYGDFKDPDFEIFSSRMIGSEPGCHNPH